jgi:hypothetical protein
MSTVSTLVAGLLDRGYEQAARATLNAISGITTRGIIAQRLTELDAEVLRLTAAGQRLTVDNAILRALLADLEDSLASATRLVDAAADQLQQDAQTAAGKVQRQLALGSTTNQQLARLGIAWNTPDPETIARLIGYVQSPAWADALKSYPAQVIDVIRNQAIRGVIDGWSPLRTAREIRRLTNAMPVHVANTLMRTLQLQSYRDATTLHQNANRDIARQVVRIAALDARTCLSCIAQHGDVVWDSERDAGTAIPRIDDHHNGRCTSVVIVRGFERPITTGQQWFDALTPSQRANLESFRRSPGKLAAINTGRATLRDFIHHYSDPVFGRMVTEATLTQVLNTTTP